MKNIKIIFIFLLLGIVTACSENKVVEKNGLSNQKNINIYIRELQNSKVDYRGYKVFNLPEGKSAVVISSGEEGNELELGKVQTSSKDTVLNIEESPEKSKIKNPYTIVEIEKITGAFYVYDNNGKEYQGKGYYKE